MQVSLAKALKLKNRLVEQVRKLNDEIRENNVIYEGQTRKVDVVQADKTKQRSVQELVNLKFQIEVASRPVRRKILLLSELKGEITFLNSLNTNEGLYPFGTYHGDLEKNYIPILNTKEVILRVEKLEAEIDRMQEDVDVYNHTTTIEVEVI